MAISLFAFPSRVKGDVEGRGNLPFSSMFSSARGEKAMEEEEEEREAPFNDERGIPFTFMLPFTRVWEGREREKTRGVKEAAFPFAFFPA